MQALSTGLQPKHEHSTLGAVDILVSRLEFLRIGVSARLHLQVRLFRPVHSLLSLSEGPTGYSVMQEVATRILLVIDCKQANKLVDPVAQH